MRGRLEWLTAAGVSTGARRRLAAAMFMGHVDSGSAAMGD
jgi:hypothetical protein